MGKSPQEGGATRRLTANDPTTDFDLLEQTISLEGAKVLRYDSHGLTPAAIPQAWILEGNPVARERRLAGSTDRRAATFMWDCTAGRFDWRYDQDEVVHVLEGAAVIEDAAGVRRPLQSGDTFLFAAGTLYTWTIPDYIRKIAFVHSPMPREMRLLSGIVEFVTAPLRRRQTRLPPR